MTDSNTYRADIDGLRAIAVLGVLLFHARLSWIPGGFVGVDVFFVISGFIITRIIVGHEGRIGAFLLNFYERRIRRLVPAAIPVLLFTAAYAWYLIPPPALEEFAKSLLAYGLFVSNWFFLSIEGYFDGPSELKPLLHTWSLSVEEQFYLLFPIPILLLMKRGLSAVRILFMTVFVLSLSLSVFLVQTNQSDMAFYNSLARFWEIALGGLLATDILRAPRTPALRQAAGLAGLGLICVSMLLYSDHMPFPGLSALVPTVGAALVILSKDGFANHLLGTKFFVSIGLISYALYLWHWPIFVLIQYTVIGAEPFHFLLGAAGATILATGSYFFIEQPVRRRVVMPARGAAFAGFVAISAMAFAFGSFGWWVGGAPSRFPVGQQYSAEVLKAAYQVAGARLRSVCWMPSNVEIKPALDRCVTIDPIKPNILLIGDSHAAHFYPAMVELMPAANISMIASDSCSLVLGDRPACNELTTWIEAEAQQARIQFDRIIISVRVMRTQTARDIVRLSKSLAERGTRVTVLGPIQYYRPNLPTLYTTMVDRFTPAQIAQAFNQAVQPEQFEVDAILAESFRNSSVDYVSLLAINCPTGPSSCDHWDSDGVPINVDDSHLTAAAARALIGKIVDAHLAIPDSGT